MPLKTRHNEEITLNLTPMIDVVFLLIIFFMVATNFSDMQRNVDLELPKVAGTGSAVPPNKPRVVTVFADGRVELDDVRVTRDELVAALSDARKTYGSELEVVLQGDGNCPFQFVADSLAACQQAGVTQIGLTVELAQAMSGSTRK
jgi:biopolymer transport protein ExbD